MSNQNNRGAGKAPAAFETRGEGYIMPRSLRMEDEIRFFPFQNGGGVIHCMIAVTETATVPDQNGQTRPKTFNIPVSIMTNKNISEQMLRSIMPGMYVRVAGKVRPETYTSKKTGEKRSTMVVNVHWMEILQGVQQPVAPQADPAPYMQGPGYAPQPYQQQGYMPQGQPLPPLYAQRQPAYQQMAPAPVPQAMPPYPQMGQPVQAPRYNGPSGAPAGMQQPYPAQQMPVYQPGNPLPPQYNGAPAQQMPQQRPASRQPYTQNDNGGREIPPVQIEDLPEN